MANELIARNPGLMLWDEPWLKVVRDSARYEAGRAILPAGRGLQPSQRVKMEAAEKSLTSLLLAIDEDATHAELFRLLAAFPAREGQAEASVKLRADAYVTACRGIPAWALHKAVDEILQGVAGFDPKWAPTPPQLAEFSRGKTIPIAAKRNELRRLLDAVVEGPLLDEAEMARRRQQVAELIPASLKRTG